jgi:hypothetical protein
MEISHDGASTDPDSDRVTGKLGALHFINWLCLLFDPAPALISTRTLPSAATGFSAAKRNTTPAIASRSGPSQAGTSTRRTS